MKKLVAVTTVILIALLAALGVIAFKGNAGGDGEGKVNLADLKDGLTVKAGKIRMTALGKRKNRIPIMSVPY